MQASIKDIKSAYELLGKVGDGRHKCGRRFKLQHVLFASLMAQLCGALRLSHQVAFFQANKLSFAKAFGGFWRHPPSQTQLTAILARADWGSLGLGLSASGGAVGAAIDGKTARGSAQPWLSLFDTGSGELIARQAFEKGREQEAFLAAMDSLAAGSKVSGDAIHCQKKHSSEPANSSSA